MKIVIQCAASKNPEAGHFRTARDGQILFVAHPDRAPQVGGLVHAHPDETSDQPGKTWRQLVGDYNARPGNNPFGLYPAYRLYANETYRTLVACYGAEQVYILSAGWGLIRADFLTPQYDVTFKQNVEPHKRRRQRDRYHDFQQLPDDDDEVVFFGGKDYLPLFCALTGGFRSPRIVFYNAQTPPAAPGCSLVRYETSMRTNWHYACAREFAAGAIGVVPVRNRP